MYSDVYHGLPSELRLMIWSAVLSDAIPSELCIGEYPYWWQPGGSLRYTAPPRKPTRKVKLEGPHAIAILRLNHETRREVLGLLRSSTILDLSNLDESQQLSKFLDDDPMWLQCAAREVIIDRSDVPKSLPCARLATDFTNCASLKESSRLYTFIDKVPQLDRLVFVIDTCRWQVLGSSDRKHSKWTNPKDVLSHLWTAEDLEAVFSRLEHGRVRQVKLFITHHPYHRGHHLFYEGFVDAIREHHRVKVEKTCLGPSNDWSRRPGAVGVDLKYTFLQKFSGCGFTIVTLTKG